MRSIKQWCAVLALACGALMSGQTNAAYTGLYVFGDSLSDTGNVQTRYEAAPLIPGVPTVPAPQTNVIGGDGYYQGRATNGLLAADYLSQGLGLGTTSTAWLEGGNNYAFGGARTHYQIYDPTGTQYLGLLQQAQVYLSTRTADPNALYLVFGGSNNLQDLLRGEDAFGGAPRSITDTVGDLRTILENLHAAGAAHFLVPNAPDLALIPRVRELGPGAQGAAAALSAAFNTTLEAMLDDLEFEVTRLDIYTLLNEVVANPEVYGLTNVTERCFTGDDLTFTGGGTICANPDDYLFWDSIHPTHGVHRILAQAALDALGVPEPGTLMLVLIGLYGLGRTRARRVAV